jgi:hypothetical protein
MNSTNANKEILFPGVKDGETFKVAGMEFIKFPNKDGKTPVVMRRIAFVSDFGENNNLKESKVLERMEKEILPKIAAEVGEENICTFKTDLTALDGLKPYGELESKISLPTMDFYRANVEIFDQHKVDCWWWLSTPESARPHESPYWVLCVAPSGGIHHVNCYFGYGVRPFLIFKSSIFGSSDNGGE